MPEVAAVAVVTGVVARDVYFGGRAGHKARGRQAAIEIGNDSSPTPAILDELASKRHRGLPMRLTLTYGFVVSSLALGACGGGGASGKANKEDLAKAVIESLTKKDKAAFSGLYVSIDTVMSACPDMSGMKDKLTERLPRPWSRRRRTSTPAPASTGARPSRSRPRAAIFAIPRRSAPT